MRHISPSGAVIPGFALDPSLSGWRIDTFTVLHDGPIIVALYRSTLDPRVLLVRLNSSGTIDKVLVEFRSVQGISQLIELPDGRILAAFWARPAGGASNPEGATIFCVLPEGGIDLTFGNGKDGFLRFLGYTSQVAFDGRWIYLVNKLYSGSPQEFHSVGFARFSLEGVMDPLFEPSRGSWSTEPYGLVASPDGSIAISSSFRSGNALVRIRTQLASRLTIRGDEVSWVSLCASDLTPGYRYALELTRDFAAWEAFATIDPQGPDWTTGLAADLPNRFFRLRVLR